MSPRQRVGTVQTALREAVGALPWARAPAPSILRAMPSASELERAPRTELERASHALQSAIASAAQGLVDRRILTELVVLAAVAREHMLVIGPPGTGKSHAVRRIAGQLQGSYFEYLLGRFTEPTDIFGAVDLAALREGKVSIQTAGMLPEADIAFLDEVFLGSTAILNTLLGLLNERVFARGHTRVSSPLRVCVGAANDIPDEPALAAFADRFLVRVFVAPLADELLESLLETGWSSEAASEPQSGLSDLDVLTRAANAADMSGVRHALAECIRVLRTAGIVLSDRRVVKTQRLVAAAGALRGLLTPTAADLWPLIYALPTKEQQELGRDVLRQHLASSENAALLAASEDASAAATARSLRLIAETRALLDARPSGAFRTRAEGILREIACAFAPEARPPELRQAEEKLAAAFEAAGP